MKYWIPTLLLCLLTALSGCEPQRDGPPIRIGYMNCNSEAETMQRFRPLTVYLEQQLGRPCEAVPVDTQDFESRFVAGDFSFTHGNSLVYVILKENHDLQLIATEQRGQFGPRTAGAIIVRRDSPIQSIADLQGKRMIFGPQLAPSGYLAQYDLMLQAGFDPEVNLDYYAIPGGAYKHEKVIYGVYFGEYDAAAAPALDLETMIQAGRISADDFRVLAQSEIIPYCTFGAAKDVDAGLVARFRKALLDLTPETTVTIDGQVLKVLDAAWIDGFEVLPDSDYDAIRAMAKRVNMPPYQEF